MTGAPDGDVDRALAAMGATPLKYYSFGVVAVRPPDGDRPGVDRPGVDRPGADRPGADRTGPPFGIPPQAGFAPTLPPTGEGTRERYRSHSVASVFPLLGLALPEAFHIDVEPVWPVGPSVSEQSVIFDQSLSSGARGAGHSRHDAADHPKFAANVDMFPQEAVRSSPTVYASPPDGDFQSLSTNGGIFVMPAWLDPAAAANGPLSASTHLPPPLPLPWLDNLPNVATPEPLKAPVTTNAELSSPAAPALSADPHPRHPISGAPVYSPFVQNGVTAPGGAFEKIPENDETADHALPPWLQERTAPVPSPMVDWSLPGLNEQHLDVHRSSASQETTSGSVSAHPMPAFAPPPFGHNTEAESVRPVVNEGAASLPEPVAPQQVSQQPTHEVAHPFLTRDDAADWRTQERDAIFQSQLHPFSANDTEPTWHEPPADTVHPNFASANKSHSVSELQNDPSVPAPPFANGREFLDPWAVSPSLPPPSLTPQAPHDNSEKVFTGLFAETPPVAAAKPPAPASSRPLADLFRTLGGGSGTGRPER